MARGERTKEWSVFTGIIGIDVTFFRSKLVQCGAICGAKEDCEAYSVESSHCYLASALGLVGTSSQSPTAKTIYVNTKIKPGSEASILCHDEINAPILLSQENGEWTSWNTWSECLEECSGPVTVGTRTRTKGCTNPLFGGMPCTGIAPEREDCVKCGKK